MTPPVRVLAADDQRVVREGLAMLLGLLPDVEVVGTAADGEEVLALAAELRPDVILMDLRMPRMDGVEATRRLRERDPAVKVVVLTTYADDRSVLDALRAGALGYLTKDAGAAEIQQALHRVAGGQAALDPAVQLHLVEAIADGVPSVPATAPLPDGLTPREAEVLTLIAAGLSNTEIAERLVVSEATVKSWRRSARATAPRPWVARTGTDSRPGRVARVKTSASLAEESETDRGSGLVVAVDGPSGAGKSSASRGAARALGLRYLDTGSMYRALTWWLLDRGADTTDPEVVARLAAEPVIEVGTDPAAPWTRVDGTDVSEAIRTREVTGAVSAVAAVPQVRARLIAMQREIIASAGGIVAEGRDIGTVVAPDAQVKVFLTADGASRASRRAAEASWTTPAEVDRRDRMDAAQSGKAADAVEVDSTGLDLNEVVGVIVGLVPKYLQKSR